MCIISFIISIIIVIIIIIIIIIVILMFINIVLSFTYYMKWVSEHERATSRPVGQPRGDFSTSGALLRAALHI